LEEENISYEHTPSGIDSISVILKSSELSDDKETLVINRIQSELDPDAVAVEHGLALIMLVGEGMCCAIGNAGHATTALGDAGINLEMINMGASEISIMIAVKETDHQKAIHALGKSFFG
jgi:aspartate kinase